MPIIGKIQAHKSESRVELMEVGSTGYVDIYDLVLTQKALFLDRLVPVVTKDDLDEDDEDGYVPIKRIGAGLTEDDFELDFSELETGEYFIPIEAECVYKELMDEKELHIIFNNPDINFVLDKTKDMSPEEHIEYLRTQMDKAADEQDFQEAARLQKQIEKEESKLK